MTIKFTNTNFVGGKAMMLLSTKEIERIRRSLKQYPTTDIYDPIYIPWKDTSIKQKAKLPEPKMRIGPGGFLI